MSSTEVGLAIFNASIGASPFRKRREADQTRGRHVYNGWPHLSAADGNCLCTNSCCIGKSGCICRSCAGVGHANCRRAQPHASSVHYGLSEAEAQT